MFSAGARGTLSRRLFPGQTAAYSDQPTTGSTCLKLRGPCFAAEAIGHHSVRRAYVSALITRAFKSTRAPAAFALGTMCGANWASTSASTLGAQRGLARCGGSKDTARHAAGVVRGHEHVVGCANARPSDPLLGPVQSLPRARTVSSTGTIPRLHSRHLRIRR